MACWGATSTKHRPRCGHDTATRREQLCPLAQLGIPAPKGLQEDPVATVVAFVGLFVVLPCIVR